jgi:DMSO/TMAO reductase YedYZ molybdopterin-dependent catalytic subunit
LTEELDWAAFDSCANCHQATWTDQDGQVWTGVPLWQLAGRVDDGNHHDAGAYKQELAEQGYTLEVIAADGYSVPFESARISRDDNVLVAYRVNDEWLSEKHFPMRLVGVGLEKNEMVGQIARISLAVPAETPKAPTGETALAITGAVEQEQALSLEALQGLDVVEISVEHPKQGLQTFRGVRLNELLDLAGIKAEATQLFMLAGDGYQTHTSLADVRACTDCLVAFTDSEGLYTVMPGMEGGLWVKDVKKIELQ